MTTATATFTKTPIRFDLVMWNKGRMGRFDSSTTYADAVMTLRVHDNLNDELGDGTPLNAEIWAVFADGTCARCETATSGVRVR